MTNRIQIVPRNKARGTDLCGQRSYQYIIRSDLDCYMKVYHVGDGDDPVTIHALHPTCAWGDLSRNFWSPVKNGPPGPSVTANFGPPLPQVVPPSIQEVDQQ